MGTGLFITTCGHKMHISCQKEAFAAGYQQNHKIELSQVEYFCYVCSALCNIFIPELGDTKHSEQIDINGDSAIDTLKQQWDLYGDLMVDQVKERPDIDSVP